MHLESVLFFLDFLDFLSGSTLLTYTSITLSLIITHSLLVQKCRCILDNTTSCRQVDAY